MISKTSARAEKALEAPQKICFSAPMGTSHKIETLDIRDFRSSDDSKRRAFVSSLKKAYEEIGFVIIKGHNVTPELQQKSYEKIQSFFALPDDTKMKYHVPNTGGARGYTPFGTEHAKDNPVSDLKEFFHVGVKVPEDHSLAATYPKNVSVDAIEGFDDALRSLYDSLLFLGTDMLRAIAAILEIDEEYFTEKVRYGNSILRPIHYPPLKGNEEPKAFRASAHEDINLITLLIGASEPGLEVLTRSGEWLPIQCEKDQIVVNVGDMLQRLSNHRLKSTTHRVVNPVEDAAAMKKSRLSVPFFLHPVSDMSLAALDTCIPPGETPKEEPITAGDYLSQRLKEIGLTK